MVLRSDYSIGSIKPALAGMSPPTRQRKTYETAEAVIDSTAINRAGDLWRTAREINARAIAFDRHTHARMGISPALIHHRPAHLLAL